MLRSLLVVAALATHSLPLASRADAPGGPSPHGHAPIGVMGDHMHGAGEVMLSYRFVRMGMDGNRSGTRRISSTSVLADPRFSVSPTEMDTETHLLGVMWAPHDRVTLSAMLPFVRKDMKHRTATGTRFTTRANGLGDVRVAALVRLLERDVHHVHLDAGVSFPTGRISAADDTPAGRQRLPYPMQLGTGTYDLLPGLTYTGESDDWSWGGQLRLTYRVGENRKHYKWGHAWGTSAWLQRRWLPWLSTSLRLDYRDWNDIRGRDDDLALIAPTAYPNLRGGERLDLLAGANFVVTETALRGNRFAVEVGRHLYQDLDGPQLETDWVLIAGWQLAF